MTDAEADPMDVAVEWHLAMPTMDADRWIAFTQWLEADPAHAAAYDAVALADHGLSQVEPLGLREETEAPRMRPALRWGLKPYWIGGAIAASIAGLLMLGGPVPHQGAGAAYAVATRAGEMRSVAVGDGSTIRLNGATRMTFIGADRRSARLEQGEALFSVHHDPAHPFTVDVGRFRVVDVGTVFNIVREQGRMNIAVAEGRVLFDPDGIRLTLGAGEAVTVDEKAGIVTRQPASDVGSWQQGEMHFSGATLGDVILALHRRTGMEIEAAAPLSDQPFTGNIHLSGKPANDARHLAKLVGADLRRDGEKWVLSSAGVP